MEKIIDKAFKHKSNGWKFFPLQDSKESASHALKNLTSSIEEISRLSNDLIPECLKSWVMDIAERTSISPEVVFVPALISFSAVIGKKLGIFPKQYDTWLVVPNLRGAVVTHEAYAVSQFITDSLAPFKRLDEQASYYSKNGKLADAQQTLSVFRTFEPRELQVYLSQNNLVKTESDILQAFQVVILNDNFSEFGGVDRNPNLVAQESAFDILYKIHGAQNFCNKPVSAVRFSKAAQEVFNDWSIEQEYKIRLSTDQHPFFVSHLKKHYSLMPSLALVFWILERPENIHGWGSISSSAAMLAIKWCRFLEKQAMKICSFDRYLKNVHEKDFDNSTQDSSCIYDSAFKILHE